MGFDTKNIKYLFSNTGLAVHPSKTMVSPDGTRVFAADSDNSTIKEYTLSTPWDLRTFAYVRSLSLAIGTAKWWTVSPNGLHLYVPDQYADVLRHWTLASPWTFDGISYSGLLNIPDIPVIIGLLCNNDGSVLSALTGSPYDIRHYDMSPAYDITTAVRDAGKDIIFTGGSVQGSEKSIDWADDGSKVFMCGGTRGIDSWSLTTPWDLLGGNTFLDYYNTENDVAGIAYLKGVSWSPDGKHLIVGRAWSYMTYTDIYPNATFSISAVVSALPKKFEFLLNSASGSHAKLYGTYTRNEPDHSLTLGSDGGANTQFDLPTDHDWLLIETFDVDGIAGDIGIQKWTDDVSDILGTMTAFQDELEADIEISTYKIEATYYNHEIPGFATIYKGQNNGTRENIILYLPEDIAFQNVAYRPRIKYIRDYINGSSSNAGNHWVEIQAIERVTGTNRALSSNGATISGSSAQNASYPYSRIIDGSTNSATYAASTDNGLQYVQIELSDIYDITSVNVWHYNLDGRTYFDTKTQVSVDGVEWFDMYDSAVSGTYAESSSGKIIAVLDGPSYGVPSDRWFITDKRVTPLYVAPFEIEIDTEAGWTTTTFTCTGGNISTIDVSTGALVSTTTTISHGTTSRKLRLISSDIITQFRFTSNSVREAHIGNLEDATNVNSLFYNCSNLDSVIWDGAFISTSLDSVFYGCNLTSFELNVDFGNVTNFRYFMYQCNTGNAGFPSNINVSGGTDFTYAWKDIYVTNFPSLDFSSAVNINYAWQFSSITTFNAPVSGFPNVTTAARAWSDCGGLSSFPIIDFPLCTNFGYAWYKCYLSSFPTIDVSSGQSFSHAWGYNNFGSFPLLDMGEATSLESAWMDCVNMTSFPAGMDFSKVTTIAWAWTWNHKMASFPDYDFPLVTNAQAAFRYFFQASGTRICGSLNLPICTNFEEMFSYSGFTKIGKITTGGSNINFRYLFYNARATCIAGIDSTEQNDTYYMFTSTVFVHPDSAARTALLAGSVYVHPTLCYDTFPLLFRIDITTTDTPGDIIFSATGGTIYTVDTSNDSRVSSTTTIPGVAGVKTYALISSDPITQFNFDSANNNITSVNVVSGKSLLDINSLCYLMSTMTSFSWTGEANYTTATSAWRGCTGLSAFPVFTMPAGPVDYGYAWYGNSMTSFPSGIDLTGGANFDYAWAYSGLTSFPDIDISAGTSFVGAWRNCTVLISFPDIDLTGAADFGYAWSYSGLTSFSLPDMSTATSVEYAWYECPDLASFPALLLPLVTNAGSAWRNTDLLVTVNEVYMPLVQNCADMFSQANSMETCKIITSGNITTASNMFNGCSSMHTPPGAIDMSLSTSLNLAFINCSSMVHAPHLGDTSLVTDFIQCFSGCTVLECIPTIDTTAATADKTNIFQSCTALVAPSAAEQTDLADADGAIYNNPTWCSDAIDLPFQIEITTISSPGDISFVSAGGEIRTIDTSDESLVSTTSTIPGAVGIKTYRLVSGYPITSFKFVEANLNSTNIHIKRIHNATSLSYLAYNETSLTSVTWDGIIPALTNMQGIFQGCTALSTHTYNSVDFSKVTNFYAAYYHNDVLGVFPITNMDSGTNFGSICAYCYNMTSFPVDSLPSAVTIGSGWYHCEHLLSFNTHLPNTVTGSLANTWRDCNALVTFVGNYDFPHVTSISYTWFRCEKMTTWGPIIFSDSLTNAATAWASCYDLQSHPGFYCSKVTNFSFAFASCHSMVSLGPIMPTVPATFQESIKECESLLCIESIDTRIATTTLSMFYLTSNTVAPTSAERTAIIGKALYENPGDCPA